MKWADQPDLFGTPSSASGLTGGPTAYVVPYDIAVNTLRKTLARLAEASVWPLDPEMRVARLDRTVPKLLAVLPADEAKDWGRRIATEAARLDAAAVSDL